MVVALLLWETSGFLCSSGNHGAYFLESTWKKGTATSSSLETVEGVKNEKESLAKSQQSNRKAKYTPKLKPLSSLAPGTQIEGVVDRVLPYGVMVRTDYQTSTFNGGALLHISQISNERIAHPNQILQKGQKIKPRVSKIDFKQNKLYLSLRKPRPPRKPVFMLTLDQEIEGDVKAIMDYGFFVDIGYKKDVLVHISRISTKKVNNVHDFVELGQRIKVRIINVDKLNKNLAGSILSKDADIYMDIRQGKDKAIIFSDAINDRIHVIAGIQSKL